MSLIKEGDNQRVEQESVGKKTETQGRVSFYIQFSSVSLAEVKRLSSCYVHHEGKDEIRSPIFVQNSVVLPVQKASVFSTSCPHKKKTNSNKLTYVVCYGSVHPVDALGMALGFFFAFTLSEKFLVSSQKNSKPVFCATSVHKYTITGPRFPIVGIRVLGTFPFCWCPRSTF